MKFTDISSSSDYLPILNAALITDLVVLIRVVLKQIKSKSLTEWYQKYQLSAIITDVLSIVIGIILTQFFYPFVFRSFSLLKFIGLAVTIQICHDLLFAVFFNMIPRGSSRIIDTFQDYGKEFGFVILLADAAMIISTILLGSLLTSMNKNTNIILLIVLLYIMPYFLYSV